MQYKVPILLNLFNRPNNTKLLIESLRLAKPTKLYIGIDGARNENDAKKIKDVIEIVKDIDWECDIKTKISEKNYGVQLAIVNNINWFFENEEFGIILEDYIIPYKEFYPYMEELLTKYKDDKRIACISGWSYFFEKIPEGYEYTYYFSHVQSSFGWATWKDRWDLMDVSMNSISFDTIKNNLKNDGIDDRIINYYNYIFHNKVILNSAWDYQFLFSGLMYPNRYCIQPIKRFVKNVGFCMDATHPSSVDLNKKVEKIDENFVMKHPEEFKYYSWLDNERNRQTKEIF